jgi:hypothetical protein
LRFVSCGHLKCPQEIVWFKSYKHNHLSGYVCNTNKLGWTLLQHLSVYIFVFVIAYSLDFWEVLVVIPGKSWVIYFFPKTSNRELRTPMMYTEKTRRKPYLFTLLRSLSLSFSFTLFVFNYKINQRRCILQSGGSTNIVERSTIFVERSTIFVDPIIRSEMVIILRMNL